MVENGQFFSLKEENFRFILVETEEKSNFGGEEKTC